MSNLPAGPDLPKDTPKAPQERAVAALQRMASPQPQPKARENRSAAAQGSRAGALAAEKNPESGSATGFVETLAKNQAGAGDSQAPIGGASEALAKLELEMAREIPRADPPAPLVKRSTLPKPPARGNRNARKGARLILALLAVLLTAIGIWAAGAVIYMRTVTPTAADQVHYPLLLWSDEINLDGDYTAGSRWMAWFMLGCLPVAGILLLLVILMRTKNGVASQRR